MICNNCQRVCNIPSCVDNIIIGSITDTDQAVYVFFQDQRSVINRLSATSDGNGLITLDLTDTANDDFEIIPEMLYDIWVTRDDAESITDKEDITVSGSLETFNCLGFKANKIRNDDNVITITSDTLKIDS